MEQEELSRLIEANDERLLSGYGAHLRAQNAEHAGRLAAQISRAALAEMTSAPARSPLAVLLNSLLGGRPGFALAGAVVAIAIATFAYVLYGGRPSAPDALAKAMASGNGVQISAQHTGPFSLTWRMPLAFNQSVALTQGDEIQTDASTTLTLTFSTGTQSVLGPNSLARIESFAPLSVRVLHGDAANLVRPATVAGVPAFEVITERGTYTARGTVYNVRVANLGDRIRTREGTVAVHTSRSEQLVAGGQEADVNDTGVITRQLSAPEVMLALPRGQVAQGGDTITVNAQQATITVTTAAGARVEAALTTLGHTSTVTSPVLADAQGIAVIPMQLPARDGASDLVVVATDISGQKLGAAASRPITIVVDRTPPPLFTLTEPANNVARTSPAHVIGMTEAGASMTINGAPIMVQGNGRFEADLPLKAGPNVIIFVVADPAGNTLRVEETIYLVP